jgi:hypothetical protein
MLQLDEPTISKHHNHLTCPYCGQTAVVQHGSIYTCLNCNFRRNVSEPDTSVIQIILLGLLASVIGFWLGITDLDTRQPIEASGIPEVPTALSTPLG